MRVELISILKDNYAYLLTSKDGMVGVVDPGEAEPILNILRGEDLSLDYIINTHHHDDHIGGNAELSAETGAILVGPAAEKNRIPNMDVQLNDGDIFHFGLHPMRAIATPGHTSGHMCFYFPEDEIVFTGDTLFSMGDGRPFEGSAEEMFASLQKLKALPDDTLVYCGHEYTQQNGQFGLSIEPDNEALKTRMDDVDRLRAYGKPTLPSMMRLEKATNVFLRAETPEALIDLRTQKDAF